MRAYQYISIARGAKIKIIVLYSRSTRIYCIKNKKHTDGGMTHRLSTRTYHSCNMTQSKVDQYTAAHRFPEKQVLQYRDIVKHVSFLPSFFWNGKTHSFSTQIWRFRSVQCSKMHQLTHRDFRVTIKLWFTLAKRDKKIKIIKRCLTMLMCTFIYLTSFSCTLIYLTLYTLSLISLCIL